MPESSPNSPVAVDVLNLRDQRKGLRGKEKARRIFLAAFVLLSCDAVVAAFVVVAVATVAAANDSVFVVSRVAVVVVVVVWVAAASPSLCSFRSFVVPIFLPRLAARSRFLSLSRSHTEHTDFRHIYLRYKLH